MTIEGIEFVPKHTILYASTMISNVVSLCACTCVVVRIQSCDSFV